MAMKWQGTYNIGTGENYSVNQIADFVGGERKYLPERRGEVKNTLADNRKSFECWLVAHKEYRRLDQCS
jgi:hypothetical protein